MERDEGKNKTTYETLMQVTGKLSLNTFNSVLLIKRLRNMVFIILLLK